MDIRETLRELIKESGQSQAKIAKEAEMSGAYLSELLHKADKSPGVVILDKIARVLGVTVDDILHPSEGHIEVPDQKYTASCIRCGTQDTLMMFPHRLGDASITGWIFACQRCAKLLYSGNVSVTFRPAE